MDRFTENQLLDTVLAVASMLGVIAEIETRDAKIGDRRVDALVRIGRGRQTRTYAVEVKKGLRPATLGAVLHQLEDSGKPPLLITDYVTPPLAEKLKVRDIAFLDAAQCIGNHSDQPRRVLDAVENILNTEADSDGDLRLVGETGRNAPNALRLLAGFLDGLTFMQKNSPSH